MTEVPSTKHQVPGGAAKFLKLETCNLQLEATEGSV